MNIFQDKQDKKYGLKELFSIFQVERRKTSWLWHKTLSIFLFENDEYE